MKYKKIIFLLMLFFTNFTKIYSFVITETIGGISTGLGGVILDKDMGGFNSIYNLSSTVFNMKNNMKLDFSASYALSPYGIQGIDNAAVGTVFGYDFGEIKIVTGFGGQFDLVQEGINEYRFYIGGGILYTGVKNLVPFINGIAANINTKIISLYLSYDISDISGFVNNPLAFDFDSDLSLSLLDNKLIFGVYLMDILEHSISFVNSVSNISKRQLFLHGKISLSENLDVYGSINLLGTPHIVDRNNFVASSTFFANTYFGLEANFAQAIFVRIGLNEGRVTGGIGLKVANFDINFGVLPISTLNLYYQLDLTYKIF